jgi:hypothetical protein
MLDFALGGLFVLGVVDTVLLALMHLQINRNVTREGERISWGGLFSSQVIPKYEKLFPDSALPVIARLIGWISVAAAVVIVGDALIGK